MADLKNKSSNIPHQPSHLLRVGLTGGIGSGKSVVATELEKYGAAIIDTDLIAHEITKANGLAMSAIEQFFGPEFLLDDGSLDRQKMRELIFADPKAKERLEKITHPLIYQETKRLSLLHQSKNPAYLVYVVPLLVESNFWINQSPKALDCIVVIDCPETQQIARVQERNGLEANIIQKIIASQASRHNRLVIADYVIENNQGIEDLKIEAQRLHQILLRHEST
jgi:dephospho-CoA kinase